MSITRVRLREAWNWGGLPFVQLAKRTWKQMDQHGTIDRAAVVAFYAMLALVPFLGFALAVALGQSTSLANLIRSVSGQFLPTEVNTIIQDQITKLQTQTPTGVLSLGFVVLLWSASSLFSSVMDALDASYGVTDRRAWWRRRLQAIVLTVVESALLLAAALSIVLWPRVMSWMGLGAVAAAGATAVQWLVVLIALFAAFSIAYYFGPDLRQEWEWITPGSTVGVLALVLATLGFRLYLTYGSSYSETYGALAGVIVTLLWLYIASLTLLLGAEINCVIEHAAPHGREPGQRDAPTRAAG